MTATTHNTKDYSENLIEEAKQIAREAIEQAHDVAIELDEPTEGMYEFDAIIIDDEQCEVAEIAIMHDFDNDWYALVERPQLNKEENEKVSKFLHTLSDFERISDHAMNIAEVAQKMNENKVRFSPEAEKEMRIGDLLQQIELKVAMLSMQCESEDEVASAWAAVTATASQSMRIRLHEIGADVDAAMGKVDHFLLTNPL